MFHPILEHLKSPEFYDAVGLVQTAAPLRRILRRLPAVNRVRMAVRFGVITESTLHDFVTSLVNEYREGYRLDGDLAIAALAVILERRPTAFAENFLAELAGLNLVEINTSSNIARECLKYRRAIPTQQNRSFAYGNRPDITPRIMAAKPRNPHFARHGRISVPYPVHIGAA